MKPAQIAIQGTESAHQIAFFAWCAIAYQHGFEIADAWANAAPGEASTLALAQSPHTDPENPALPCLKWIHHIPNGGSRGDSAKSRAVAGGKLKAEGVRPGIADIFLPWPLWDCTSSGTPVHVRYCGLYIEMKKPSMRNDKKSGLSDEQSLFGKYAADNMYGWCVCFTWREAADVVKSYVNYGKPQ